MTSPNTVELSTKPLPIPEKPKPMPVVTATVFIPYPKTVTADRRPKKAPGKIQPQFTTEESIKLPLRWWNTFYKAPHVFTGGRVEVLCDETHMGYDRPRKGNNRTQNENDLFDCNCPYCKKPCRFSAQRVHQIKGHIHCPFCKKQYGIHPNGQMFVVRDLVTKVTHGIPPKEMVKTLLFAEAYQADWEVNDLPNGVEVTLTAASQERLDEAMDDLGRLLKKKGLTYREE